MNLGVSGAAFPCCIMHLHSSLGPEHTTMCKLHTCCANKLCLKHWGSDSKPLSVTLAVLFVRLGCVCAHGCVSVEAKGHCQISSSVTSSPYFWGQGLSLHLGSPTCFKLASELVGATCLWPSSPKEESTDAPPHSAFTHMLGVEPVSLSLCRKPVIHWASSTAPD